LQVLANRYFNFGVARQGPSGAHPQSFGSLFLRRAVITYAMLNHDARSLLRKHLARPVITVCLLLWHSVGPQA
jgi:hypothetical protein